MKLEDIKQPTKDVPHETKDHPVNSHGHNGSTLGHNGSALDAALPSRAGQQPIGQRPEADSHTRLD
jgi:hypothetical protein